MKTLLIGLGLLVLPGCINISTQLQPVNPTIQPALKGKDCTPILLGLGFGSNTIATAMRHASGTERYDFQGTQIISRIHSIELLDISFLNLVGHRCLEVAGEP